MELSNTLPGPPQIDSPDYDQSHTDMDTTNGTENFANIPAQQHLAQLAPDSDHSLLDDKNETYLQNLKKLPSSSNLKAGTAPFKVPTSNRKGRNKERERRNSASLVYPRRPQFDIDLQRVQDDLRKTAAASNNLHQWKNFTKTQSAPVSDNEVEPDNEVERDTEDEPLTTIKRKRSAQTITSSSEEDISNDASNKVPSQPKKTRDKFPKLVDGVWYGKSGHPYLPNESIPAFQRRRTKEQMALKALEKQAAEQIMLRGKTAPKVAKTLPKAAAASSAQPPSLMSVKVTPPATSVSASLPPSTAPSTAPVTAGNSSKKKKKNDTRPPVSVSSTVPSSVASTIVSPATSSIKSSVAVVSSSTVYSSATATIPSTAASQTATSSAPVSSASPTSSATSTAAPTASTITTVTSCASGSIVTPAVHSASSSTSCTSCSSLKADNQKLSRELTTLQLLLADLRTQMSTLNAELKNMKTTPPPASQPQPTSSSQQLFSQPNNTSSVVVSQPPPPLFRFNASPTAPATAPPASSDFIRKADLQAVVQEILREIINPTVNLSTSRNGAPPPPPKNATKRVPSANRTRNTNNKSFANAVKTNPLSTPQAGTQAITETAAIPVTQPTPGTSTGTFTSSPQHPAQTAIATFNTSHPDGNSHQDFPPLNTYDWQTARGRRGRRRVGQSQPDPPLPDTEPPPPPKKTPARKGPWGLPPKANTTLLLPTADNVKILDELEKTDAIDPRELGIKKKIPFANGALLVTCKDADAVQKLHTLLPLVKGVKAKEAPPPRHPSIRIHSVPEKTTVDQLQGDITERLGTPPVSIKFVAYKQPLVPGTKLAVCEVTATAFEVAARKKTIVVGWKPCRIDVNPHLSRCLRCGLLGHSVKNCQRPEDMVVPEQVAASQVIPAAPEPCKDCAAYNTRVQTAKLGKRRLRKTDHLTGDSQCPTKRHYMQRARPVKPPAPQEPAAVAGGPTIEEIP